MSEKLLALFGAEYEQEIEKEFEEWKKSEESKSR